MLSVLSPRKGDNHESGDNTRCQVSSDNMSSIR